MGSETPVKCPQCRSKNFTVYAHEQTEECGDVVNGKLVSNWGMSAMPNRLALFGRCRCGHEWKFRNKWAL